LCETSDKPQQFVELAGPRFWSVTSNSGFFLFSSAHILDACTNPGSDFLEGLSIPFYCALDNQAKR
jgi:hypothetical protein